MLENLDVVEISVHYAYAIQLCFGLCSIIVVNLNENRSKLIIL